MKHHQTLRRGLSALLSLLLCLTLLPAAALAADDDNTGSTAPKAIQLGTGGLLSPSMKKTNERTYYAPQSYVYFGADAGYPIQWRVLDAEQANDDKTDGIFLLSENALTQTAFNAKYHQDGEEYHKGEAPSDNHTACIPANRYQGSDAQQWCSRKVDNDFSSIEQDAMLGVAKDDAAIPDLFDRNWGASSLTENDKLFFLSVQELYDHVGTYDAAPGMAVSSQDNWWLRTPRAGAKHSNRVGGVNWSGWPWSFEVDNVRQDGTTFYNARPAFNLNKDAVLMISDFHTSSKTKGDVGQLTAVGEAQNVMYETTAREWKLTLKDSSRSSFTARVTEVSGDTLTVSYENAATGENEYLSALVKGSDGTVKFYGRILELDTAGTASGTASITLPEGFALAADHLFVYSEQCHDGRMTDYASKLIELKLPEYAISADPTELDFGSVPTGFTAVPAAKTVTITNTGTKAIEVPLPTSGDYEITAGDGFTSGKATLAPNAKASFTVQPKAGRDSYANKLTVTTGQTDVQCEIKLSFTRSDTQLTEYAQVTLVNDGYAIGCQMLLFDSNKWGPTEYSTSIPDHFYDDASCKLPENADPAKNAKNLISNGKSVSILVPAKTYDYFIAAPTVPTRESEEQVPGYSWNDVSFEAGKRYTLTISANGTVTYPKVETILPIYTVTASGLYGGAMGIKPGETYVKNYVNGERVGLQIGKRDGYTLDQSNPLKLEGITEEDLNWEAKEYEVTNRGIYFKMPENSVTITVNWVKNGSSSSGSGSSGSSTYPVTVTGKIENGSVTVSPKNAGKGDTVTITVTPDEGYTLETLTVTDKNGSKLTLKDKGNGKYTFTQPSGKVTVTATFMDDNTMLNYFADVKASDYFYDAVLWAAQKGITSGTDAAHFSPYAPCTRAQIVTFLWRAAGSPVVNYAMNMSDVPEDAYYAEAVRWALSQSITTGTSDTAFSPDAPCTRAQAVAFLFRAAGSPAVSDGNAFSDVAANAYYADAVTWAEKNGVTGGIGGGLFGSGRDCTRAQIVTFLYRAYQGK